MFSLVHKTSKLQVVFWSERPLKFKDKKIFLNDKEFVVELKEEEEFPLHSVAYSELAIIATVGDTKSPHHYYLYFSKDHLAIYYMGHWVTHCVSFELKEDNVFTLGDRLPFEKNEEYLEYFYNSLPR
jgi:hypothetical protein